MTNKKELLVDEKPKILEKNCVGECPYCGSDEISAHDYKQYGNCEEQFFVCDHCGKRFSEVSKIKYAYTEYEEAK